MLRLLLYPLLLGGAASLAVGHSASGQAGPALSFDVGTSGFCVAVDDGDEFVVGLLISNAEELQSWEATITHDFDVIRILDRNIGAFLSNGTPLLEPLPDLNGRHFLGIAGNSSVSVSGSGVLATIKFEAVGAGISTIDIPQNDFDDNGTTDEGAILTKIGGAKIDDVNGDNFFDGPVQSALVSVGGSCGSATNKPTDPPTPTPAGASPTTGVTTATGTVTPSGDATSTPAGTADEDPTGDASESPVSSNVGDQPTPGDGDTSEAGGGGSSFPVWLVGVLLAGGLGLGAAVVIVGLRSSRGRPMR